MIDLGFTHQFIPSRGSTRTLLLLHGTGGDETQLLSLGRALDENAALLSPRGKVLEHGHARFFRRISEGVFDEADVIARAKELAEFIRAATASYQFDAAALIAVGYSNGANIASAMMLLGLMKFGGAILLRPMVPLTNPPIVSLQPQPVLICAGKSDPLATPENVAALAELLRSRAAKVELQLLPAGHELGSGDVTVGRDWLAGAAVT